MYGSDVWMLRSRDKRTETRAMNFPRSVLQVALTGKTKSEDIRELIETENVIEERKLAGIYDKDDL
jgi:hypothetical protein